MFCSILFGLSSSYCYSGRNYVRQISCWWWHLTCMIWEFVMRWAIIRTFKGQEDVENTMEFRCVVVWFNLNLTWLLAKCVSKFTRVILFFIFYIHFGFWGNSKGLWEVLIFNSLTFTRVLSDFELNHQCVIEFNVQEVASFWLIIMSLLKNKKKKRRNPNSD